MVTDILQPTHLLFVLVVALLVLGPKRLPEVARTLGNGLRDFREAISGESRDEESQPGHYTLHQENEPEVSLRTTATAETQSGPATEPAPPAETTATQPAPSPEDRAPQS